MSDFSVSEARSGFAEIVNRAAYRGERAVIQRRGKRVAAVVPVEDLEILEAIEDHLDVEAARQALKERGAVRWETLKAELGL